MGERRINPLFNVHDVYTRMKIINPYRFGTPLSPIIVAPEFNVSSGTIYISTDLGSNWSTNTAAYSIFSPNLIRYAIARNGVISLQPYGTNTKPVGAYSTDGGANFSGVSISDTLTQLSGMSYNGQHIIFGSYGNSSFWYSTDSGSTWNTHTTNVVNPISAAASDDGNYLYYADYTDTDLQRSTNGMTSWSAVSTPYASYNLNYVICSSDGSRVIASPRNIAGKIWISSDYGATGTDTVISTGEGTGATQVSASSDLQHICVAFNGKVYTSNDYGSNWTRRESSLTTLELPPNNQAVSSSGKYMVFTKGASASNGQFYLSEDYGATWTEKTISGASYIVRGLAIDD